MTNRHLQTSPNVTAVIPAFNAENCIQDAVESIARQTHQGWLLIVVDDGSTDSTGSILKTMMADMGSRIEVLSGPNMGACHARNWALRHVKTEFVAFLDADDYWHPEKLERQIKSLTLRPELVGITTGYRLQHSLSGNTSRDLDFQWSRKELLNWTLLGRRAPGLNSTLMVRRQAILDVGCYDEDLISYADDLDLAWRLLGLGPIASIPDPLTTLVVSGGQIHRDFSQMAKALELVYGKIENREPEVVKTARQNLYFYLALRQTSHGNLVKGTLGFLRSVLFQPFTSLRFMVRKFKDSGRLRLRRSSLRA